MLGITIYLNAFVLNHGKGTKGKKGTKETKGNGKLLCLNSFIINKK